MGNDQSDIVLDTKWTPEGLSQFMLNLGHPQQTQRIFGNTKTATRDNLQKALVNTVALYLLNENVKAIQGAKVKDVNVKVQEYKSTGQIAVEMEPLTKFILENKMTSDDTK